MKVLLVEDDPTILKLMQIVCQKEGYEFSLATTGTDALNRLKRETFDIVVSDEMLPGVCGHEIAEWMRQETRYKSTPFVLISAEQNPRLFGSLSGDKIITSFIPKPFKLTQLTSVLDTLRLIRLPGKSEAQSETKEIEKIDEKDILIGF